MILKCFLVYFQTTENDLSRIFCQNGTITEISLKRNSQGKSRHFAFIGYHNAHDADEAIKALNNTFIKMNKIQVEKCNTIPRGTESIYKVYNLMTCIH